MGKIIEIRDYKLNKQPKTIKILVFIIMIVVLLFLLFMSPIFSVQDIILCGNEYYSKDEIINKININKEESIFLFQKNKGEKILCDDIYIESADIEIIWPNKIEVIINERKIVGYVPYLGTYLYIDKDGRVLETSSTYNRNLPIVEGLEFDSFKIGQIIPVKNKSSLDVIATMSQMMLKYDLLQEVIKIDVSDPNNTHLYVKKLDVSVGGLEQFDKKMQWLVQIMDVYDMGKLDLRNINTGKAVFSPLT